MIFATNNKGKLKEIKGVLGDDVKGISESGIFIDVVEDGKSFYENALIKAKTIYEIAKEPVIADDSGLCVLALDNWPGVFTHRCMGDDVTDSERNNGIITKVNNLSNNDRRAKVMCHLVYYDGNEILDSIGEMYGKITTAERGQFGYGFDPIFEMNNGKTLAEITPEEKHKISPRVDACKKLLGIINLKNVSNK